VIINNEGVWPAVLERERESERKYRESEIFKKRVGTSSIVSRAGMPTHEKLGDVAFCHVTKTVMCH
jgi:hypothetical protein